MPFFKVKAGKTSFGSGENLRVYKAGEVFESDQDMVAYDSNKFEYAERPRAEGERPRQMRSKLERTPEDEENQRQEDSRQGVQSQHGVMKEEGAAGAKPKEEGATGAKPPTQGVLQEGQARQEGHVAKDIPGQKRTGGR